MDLTLNEILSALRPLSHTLPASELSRLVAGISTDTRKICRGEVFFAINGERFDGHTFISKAKDKGAIAAVVEKSFTTLPQGLPLLKVADTIQALGQIAAYYRRKFSLPVVAVTGSNGKTTTKEMLAAVLGVNYTVWKNSGTENNHIGLPQTLLGLDNRHSAAIVELGMNHPGEIRYLADMARPDIAVITNVGFSHLEFMDSLENIARAKCELLEKLPPAGIAVVNADCEILLKQALPLGKKVLTFAINRPADFSASEIKQELAELSFTLNKTIKVRLPILGVGNVYNALAALAVGQGLDIPCLAAARALEQVVLPKWRLQLFDLHGAKIIADCYNANPASVQLALETLAKISGFNRRLVVLGDMLELGRHSIFHHQQIGQQVAAAAVDILITVGDFGRVTLEAARQAGMGPEGLLSFPDLPALQRELPRLLRENDIVLIKGSRRMRMERLLECSTISSTL